MLETRNAAIADKPRDARRGWPLKHTPATQVLPRQIWSFYVNGCWHKKENPKNWGALGPSPLADPGKTRPSSMSCATESTLVAQSQIVWA